MLNAEMECFCTFHNDKQIEKTVEISKQAESAKYLCDVRENNLSADNSPSDILRSDPYLRLSLVSSEAKKRLDIQLTF